MVKYALVTMISKEHGLQTAKIPMSQGETAYSISTWIERKVEELELSAGWQVSEIISH